MSHRSQRAPLWLLIGWIAFIFGTSCTVVRPQEFFAWLHTHVFTDDALYERFRVFWGVSWFAIVKGWHFTEFAILQFLLVRLVRWWMGRESRGAILSCMAGCVAFAISDEWHQSFVADRMGTATDVVIDSLGVLAVGVLQLRGCRRSI